MQTIQKRTPWPGLFADNDCPAGSGSEFTARNEDASRKPPRITAAEKRVLALVAQARTNKEIASDLRISPATVKRHMEKILKKLRLRNRVEAAIFGLMLNGCPHRSSPGCAFGKLQLTLDDTAARGPFDP
jgi:DNA-binding CsgD family transcriptional regulator